MPIPEIPVKVNVKTTIDQQEAYELIVFGRFYEKEHTSYLQYEEELEEGSVRTIVKMAAEEVLILRSGAVKMRLPFQLNRKMNGSYEMPFGRFETSTLTKKMNYSFSEKGNGLIDIIYDFTLQGSPAGTYHLEITFLEDKK